MWPLFSLLLIISLQCASSYTETEKPQEDIIKQTCQTCAQMSSHSLSYDFCYSSLAKVPLSHVTNLAGLGVVAMELALQNATKSVSTINSMLEDKNASDTRCSTCLESCLELYSGMSAIFEECVAEFLSMQYDPVYLWVSTIMQAPGICEAGFRDKGEESPLTKENYSLSQLCGTVLCIIDLISPTLKSSSPSLLRFI